MLTKDKKITCSNCGEINSALKVRGHFFECMDKKS